MIKRLTVCVIERDGQILLGRKKRGFGVGLLNAFGGKVMEGETLEQGAIRETREEAGVAVTNLVKRGVITFEFKDKPDQMEVHFWSTCDFTGEPVETDEMAPQWFSKDALPYDQMFTDNRYWLPLLLAGKNFGGSALYIDAYTMISQNIYASDVL